jgi:hypothetical protein
MRHLTPHLDTLVEKQFLAVEVGLGAKYVETVPVWCDMVGVKRPDEAGRETQRSYGGICGFSRVYVSSSSSKLFTGFAPSSISHFISASRLRSNAATISNSPVSRIRSRR